MKKLMEMLENCQDVNVVEKGINFAESSFTQIYEQALKANDEYLDDLDIAGRNGIIIGAASTGLIVLGAVGINKLIKRKRKDKKEV